MIIWLRSGETAGAGREADRIDDIFPFDITYTVQKSGAPFETFPGTSVVLNLLWATFEGYEIFQGTLTEKIIHNLS